MRISSRTAIFLLAFLVAPVPQVGAGVMDPVTVELAAVRDGLNPGDKADASVMKKIDKLLATLQTLGPTTPLLSELKIAGKVAATIDKGLSGRGDLAMLLLDAAAAYRTAIESARERVSVAIALMPLEAKARAALVKSLTALDAGLSSLTPAASASYTLKVLGKVAKRVVSIPSLDDGVEANWVVDSISLAPANEGVDLDGDQTPDNAFGALAPLLALAGVDVNQILADTLTASANVLLIQMWWSESDGMVLAGLLNGADTDGDPTDNFSGTEPFTVAAGLEGDGHPTLRQETDFTTGGGYSLTFDGTGITLPGLGLALPDGLPVAMRGTAAAASNTGLIGFAIPVDLLAAIIVGMGQPDPTATLSFLADIDLTPETPGNDALSAAMKFTAVPASIQ